MRRGWSTSAVQHAANMAASRRCQETSAPPPMSWTAACASTEGAWREISAQVPARCSSRKLRYSSRSVAPQPPSVPCSEDCEAQVEMRDVRRRLGEQDEQGEQHGTRREAREKRGRRGHRGGPRSRPSDRHRRGRQPGL